MKSRKPLSKFNTDWLINEKYRLWLAKGKNDNRAKCIICSKEIDLSTMGANAPDSHAKSKKHCDIVTVQLDHITHSLEKKKSQLLVLLKKAVKKYVRTAKL